VVVSLLVLYSSSSRRGKLVGSSTKKGSREPVPSMLFHNIIIIKHYNEPWDHGRQLLVHAGITKLDRRGGRKGYGREGNARMRPYDDARTMTMTKPHKKKCKKARIRLCTHTGMHTGTHCELYDMIQYRVQQG
jgi:hypothetical protein